MAFVSKTIKVDGSYNIAFRKLYYVFTIFQMYVYNAIFHRLKMFRVIQRDGTCILLPIGAMKDKEIIAKNHARAKDKTQIYFLLHLPSSFSR